jgi:hypothetical protein
VTLLFPADQCCGRATGRLGQAVNPIFSADLGCPRRLLNFRCRPSTADKLHWRLSISLLAATFTTVQKQGPACCDRISLKGSRIRHLLITTSKLTWAHYISPGNPRRTYLANNNKIYTPPPIGDVPHNYRFERSTPRQPSILKPLLAALSPRSPQRARSSAVMAPPSQPPSTISLKRNCDSSRYGRGGSAPHSCSMPSTTGGDGSGTVDSGRAVREKLGVISKDNESEEASEEQADCEDREERAGGEETVSDEALLDVDASGSGLVNRSPSKCSSRCRRRSRVAM